MASALVFAQPLLSEVSAGERLAKRKWRKDARRRPTAVSDSAALSCCFLSTVRRTQELAFAQRQPEKAPTGLAAASDFVKLRLYDRPSGSPLEPGDGSIVSPTVWTVFVGRIVSFISSRSDCRMRRLLEGPLNPTLKR